MKKLLLLKFLVLTGFWSFAQNTYDATYHQNAGFPGGVRTGAVATTTGWTSILPASQSTNLWSGPQTIPFSFNFFGSPVTQFKVSANMLLTFDVASALLPNNNTNLPTAVLPNNTIAAYWDEFTNTPPTATNDAVWVNTFGTAPNRQFWVVWYSFEYANMSFAYNAIVLEETTNKVYVVDQYSASAGGTTTVGLQLNSTTAVQAGNDQVPLEGNGSATAQVDYYQFAPRVIVATDVAAVALVSPVAAGCYSATQSVQVEIKNFGTNAVSNIPVAAKFTNGSNVQTLTGTHTASLAPNATATVTLTNANMSAAGTYSIKAYTALASDQFRGNDTLATTTRTVTPTASLPQTVDFTGFTGTNLTTVFPNWYEATGYTMPTGTTGNWNPSSAAQTTTLGSTTAKINIFGTTVNSWIVGPKVMATATTAVSYKIAITGWNQTTPYPAGMDSDDKVQVMVSTDCGGTFNPVFTHDATNTGSITNALSDQMVSLGTYAGQNIIVAFLATSAATGNDYDFHIDDIFLGTPPTTDLAVTAFVNPAEIGCYSATQNVTVTVKNVGIAPINFVNNPGTVTVTGVGSPINATLSGILAVGATQNISVGTVNMAAAGTYNLTAYSAVTGDGNASNDTITTSRTMAPIASLAQRVDFTGFTGANLTTVFPGWYEASGTPPTGTTSGWTTSAASQTTAFGSNSARINLDAASDRVWIIGPKITPTSSTVVEFKTAITNWNNADPDPDGMAGTDDMFQVMVSTDCGATFTPIFTVDATTTPALTNTLTQNSVSLAAYAGQNIIVAFFATEGTANDLADYDFHLDDIFIGTPPTTDAEVIAFVNPATTGCYTAAENVTVTIRNSGIAAINFANNPGTVRVFVNGNTTPITSAPLTGTLAIGATRNVSVGTVNMLAPGTYDLMAIATVTGDSEAFNDTLRMTFTVAPVVSLPQNVNFTGFTGSNLNTVFPNWYEATGATTPAGTTSAWTSSVASQTTLFGSTTAKINFPTATGTIRNEWIVGPKVAVTSVTHLQFTAAVTTTAAAASTMNPSDTVFVMYSTDCGVTFNPIGSINASHNLTNAMQPFDLNVGSLAGQTVIFAFKAVNALPRPATAYDLHIDDVVIRNMFATDIAPVMVIVPASACRTTTEQICVIVENQGTSSLSNIPVAYRVNNGALVTGTIPGPLAAGDTVRFCFATPANLNTAGAYTIEVITSLSNDNFRGNDTVTTVVNSFTSSVAAPAVAICGPGTANLTATSNNPNATFNWYTTATGNTPVFTGAAYSPSVSATTTYYVEASAVTENVGKATNTATTTYNFGEGLIFNATQPFILNSVDVYTLATTAGPLTVNLVAADGTTILASTTVTLPAVTGLTAVTVPLGFSVPAGTGMSIRQASNTPIVRETGVSFPFTSPSGIVTITNGTIGGNYYFFYNWSVSIGCPSARIPVVATVNSVPAPAFTGLNATYCSNAAPVTLASNLAGSTFTINGTAATTLNPGTLTVGTHTVVVSNTANGCTGSATQTVTINAAPAAPTSVLATSYCQNAAPVTLVGGTNSYTIDGNPVTTFTASSLTVGAHTVVVSTTSGGCTSTTTHPLTIVATPATPTISAAGFVLTSSASGGNQWYLNGNALANATGTTHTAVVNGTYTVVSTVGGCASATSAGLVINNVGISKNMEGRTITVYPNPTNGQFEVKLNGFTKDASIALYNLTGQLIATETVKGNAKESVKKMNIANLATGVYLLKVTSETSVQVTRLTVE